MPIVEPRMQSTCLIVLNFNGMEHLDDCLASATKAAGNVPLPAVVVLLDNCSSDESVLYVRENYPDVEIIVAPKNDLLFSFNEIVRRRREDVILLLNNDMRFEARFLAPLLQPFEDPDVFAVTSKILNWEGTKSTTGRRLAEIRQSWFYMWWDFKVDQACYTLDACGGAGAYRRTMFLALGGFDRLYHPGYYEDVDLSYRAWKRGWRVVYQPSSIIYHKIGASFGKTESSLRTLLTRNHILFSLKNCSGWSFVFSFLLLLPMRVLRRAVAGDRAFVRGSMEAIPRILAALSRRLSSWAYNSDSTLSDYQILEIIRKEKFIPNPNNDTPNTISAFYHK
jgi:O-antigen biosynthesis protein